MGIVNQVEGWFEHDELVVSAAIDRLVVAIHRYGVCVARITHPPEYADRRIAPAQVLLAEPLTHEGQDR
ncbi:MAG TPA: hypothetical protein VJ045_06100 [Hyphomicrobiaceae bacterium]|nr:hypothetical protein [Hyphomicrobiaceae bacterium]